MLFWSVLLIVYIILPFYIDIGKLDILFRHIWNFIPFILGMYLIYRTKMKQRVGYIEKLEDRVGELADRYENIKFNTLHERFEAMEKRLITLEQKIGD